MELVHSFQRNVNTKLILQRETLRVTNTGKTQRDGMGKEVGGGVQDGRHMYTHGWFMSIYGKKKNTTIL